MNLERRFQGSIDVPLNDAGMAQAKEAARVLSAYKISRIISSPASRVLQTASFIASIETTVHVEKDLMELHVGSFEGRCIETIRKEHGLGEHESFLSILPEDADKWHEFVPRVCAAVQRWTDRHASDTLLIAAHGLVFSALAITLTGKRQLSGKAVPYHF